jgi:Tol biopolymer transport system component
VWTGEGGIVLSNADGSGQRVIVANSPATTSTVVYSTPDLSPDGKQVLMGSTDRGLRLSSHIYVASTTGGGPHRMDDRAVVEYAPRWSPDGMKIAYAQWNVQWQRTDIAVMNGDGTNPRIIAANGSNPYWSPDGQRLVFTSGQPTGGLAIETIEIDGTNLRNLGVTSSGPAVWSPDGTKIAFQQGGYAGIAVMNADGTSMHGVTTAPGYLRDWDPDSLHLLVAVGNQGGQGPYALDVLDASSGQMAWTVATGAILPDASWQRPR